MLAFKRFTSSAEQLTFLAGNARSIGFRLFSTQISTAVFRIMHEPMPAACQIFLHLYDLKNDKQLIFVKCLGTWLLRLCQVIVILVKPHKPAYPKTVRDFRRQFASEESCIEYLIQGRWPEGFACSRCGHEAYC